MNNKSYNPAWSFAKWWSKYMPASDLTLNLILPAVLMLPVFVFSQIKNQDSFLNLIICGSLYFIITGYLIVSNVNGKRRHKTILFSKRFSPLKEMGFEIENRDNYWGYRGIYKNYFFRIYYNWNTKLKRQVDFSEITIQLSFVPFEIRKNKFDVEKIIQLNKKYKNNWRQAKIYEINFGLSFIEFHYPFGVFTSFQNIKTSIDEVLRIAREENLIPISEKELNKLIKDNAFAHGPAIETFQEAKNVIQN